MLNPQDDAILSSMSGEELDPQLVDLTAQGKQRRRFFMQQLMDPHSPLEKPDPVFVTPAERTSFHDIASQTKEVISRKIVSLLDAMNQGPLCDSYQELWHREVRTQRKDNLVAFYKRLEEEVQAASIVECNQSM